MLYHFSENPSISVFRPHVAATAMRQDEARVWAVDREHAPGFWFPRDCPRACCWLREGAAPADAPDWFKHGGARRLHAIQVDWLSAMRGATLYAYKFDPAPFVLENAEAGHWVTREDVTPLRMEPVGDLMARHAQAGIELRIAPDLQPLIEAIAASGLGFSIYRKANLRRP